MLLLAGAFAELFANYKALYATVVELIQPVIQKIFRSRRVLYKDEDVIEEPCSPSELVPTWMWGGGVGTHH